MNAIRQSLQDRIKTLEAVKTYAQQCGNQIEVKKLEVLIHLLKRRLAFEAALELEKT